MQNIKSVEDKIAEVLAKNVKKISEGQYKLL